MTSNYSVTSELPFLQDFFFTIFIPILFKLFIYVLFKIILEDYFGQINTI